MVTVCISDLLCNVESEGSTGEAEESRRKLMIIKKETDIPSSEVTDKKLYLTRRQFLTAATALVVAGAVPVDFARGADTGQKLIITKRGKFAEDEKVTSASKATTYNNFYEFSVDKEDVAERSKSFRTRPWTVSVEGYINKPKVYSIDELIKLFPLEERIYRFRCVEGWSMVIPWVGFPLGDFIKRCEPASKAKYIELTTLKDQNQMPGQKRDILEWPYVEGLRLDEALNPLALLVVGMYGEIIPNQNGAPLRLMVPWKYGFKSIKSIVRIRFVEQMPISSWMKANPAEYGFYANVNPEVDHPRWSQARETRIGELTKRKTLMFNGYEKEVAHMYKGMDLKKYF
jgi:sulfoxide reductase catalytic subunit YedY